MLKHLNGLVAALLAAVDTRDTGGQEAAQAALVDWCDRELVPHALCRSCRLSPALSLAGAVQGLHELVGRGHLGAHEHQPEQHDDGARHR